MRFLPGLTSDSPVGGKINLRLILMSLITFTADLNNINACNCCCCCSCCCVLPVSLSEERQGEGRTRLA